MAIPTILEKLHLVQQKNMLIQGLPSSLEKPFAKLSFAKNLTPLLRSRKVDFALVFAVSIRQLTDILREIKPALNTDSRLWIATPKPTAKIASDLCRHPHWPIMDELQLVRAETIELDTVWCATEIVNYKHLAGQTTEKKQRTTKIAAVKDVEWALSEV
ncbi:MAG: hypothetical protein ACKO5C_05150 [Ferruginibacter sp.]